MTTLLKKRILMVGESSHIKSGFGNYTREILSRLYSTGKYEIAELSSYRTPSTPKTEPWTVYPVAVDPGHPLFSEYTSNQNNQYGQWRFEFTLLDFKPHIVFDIRDFWNYTFQETSPLRKFYHWIINPTYDSAPPRVETINTFKNADTVLFHTHWAKNNLINEYNYDHNNLGHVASDAVDSNIFKPIGYSKKFHKIKFGIEPESFVIGSVMRNQKRKLIPDIIKIASNLIKKNTDKKIYLYLHTSFPDALAWDLPNLLLEHNISNNVLISYLCKSCGTFQCKVFKGIKTICNRCKQSSSSICHPTNAVDDITLNNIYNLFDVYLQYAICEGFGIPPIEAASAGIPVVTVNHEAMGEIGSNIGALLVDTKRLFREQETNADRCLPDNENCEQILQSLIEMPVKELNNIGKNTRNKLLNTYSWDRTAKIYEEIFDNIDISKKLSWNIGPQNLDMGKSISNVQSNRDFIYSIVDDVIKDPSLKKTNFIQELIKGLDDQMIQEGVRRMSFERKNAVKILEIYANNKNAIEQMRLGIIPLSDKLSDFIEYSKK